jgi:hypothetical protein
MGQREKLLESLRKNPKNVRFQDLDRLLRLYGYDCRPTGGTHYFYKRKGCHPISVPFARPVKENYVRAALRSIEECMEPEAD